MASYKVSYSCHSVYKTLKKNCLFETMCTETSKRYINHFSGEELQCNFEYSLILIAVEIDYLGTDYWK